MTPLDKTLKRSIIVKGIDYVVTLSPESLKLTRKGKRLGLIGTPSSQSRSSIRRRSALVRTDGGEP